MKDRLRRVGILGHTGRPGVRRTALALARRIGQGGPLATRGAKRIINVRNLAGPAAGRALADALRHALGIPG